ncbi:hypothetical protein, partial [Salmonella enterica]|uniref:hypothetical protein n=1 Tax=Salmonella enterica TaxID=28901 RepID=UPI003CF253B0
EEALAEANSLQRDGKPGEALQRLEQLLRQLPQGEPYSAMASAVYELRERVRSDVDADDLYHQTSQAMRDDNHELAIELAQAVPSTSQR